MRVHSSTDGHYFLIKTRLSIQDTDSLALQKSVEKLHGAASSTEEHGGIVMAAPKTGLDLKWHIGCAESIDTKSPNHRLKLNNLSMEKSDDICHQEVNWSTCSIR